MNKPIKDFLQKIIPHEHLWKIALFNQWPTIIGPRMNQKVFIEKIENDVLSLRVTHPAWAQELHMLTPLLKEKINACFDVPKINFIRYHYRKEPHNPESRSKKASSPTLINPHNIELKQEELSVLAPLACKELQLSVAAYLRRCKTFKRSKDEKK